VANRRRRDWLKIPEAAQVLGCHERTVRRMIKDGRIPAAAIWREPRRGGDRIRIDPEAIRALMRESLSRAQPSARFAFVCLAEVLSWSDEEASEVADRIGLLWDLPDPDRAGGVWNANEAILLVRRVAQRVLKDGLPVKLDVVEQRNLELLANYRQQYELERAGPPDRSGREPVTPVIIGPTGRGPFSGVILGPRPRVVSLDADAKRAAVARADAIIRLRLAARALWPILTENGNVTLHYCPKRKRYWVEDKRAGGRRQRICPYCRVGLKAAGHDTLGGGQK